MYRIPLGKEVLTCNFWIKDCTIIYIVKLLVTGSLTYFLEITRASLKYETVINETDVNGKRTAPNVIY